MTALFDGLAGALVDTFGAPVTVSPTADLPRTVRGVLREYPVDDGTGDGRRQATILPTLRLMRPDAEGVGRGAMVEQGGRFWRVLRPVPSSSPAADAVVIFEMELLP